ncbi:WbqC family protein [Candidatus Peregrinibacteria bacterium]|nr:WbqC family protein [Candidatus Peregrinibacteria bacterium]
MIITIHQPEYLPWLGFFDRIIKSDIFVILDHVQYQKNCNINRNRIKNANGPEWLTVPVYKKMDHMEISKVQIQNNLEWREKHYKTIVMNYAKAAHFAQFHDLIKGIYEQNWDSISELDTAIIMNILEKLGVKKKIYKSSSLNPIGKSTDMLVDICKKLNGDAYLSGEGGKRYMDTKAFDDAGIKIMWQAFTHPVYTQQYTKLGFISHLSFIDLLFNHGMDSLEILKHASL